MAERDQDLARIEKALRTAAESIRDIIPGAVDVEHKADGDPVTEADRRVNAVLAEILPRPGEGWLSEETADDLSRLQCERVWIVDPIDGTREFIQAIPEWCLSVGLVEDGRAIAGGILSPSRDEIFLGAVGEGMTLNGAPVALAARHELSGGVVLASRSEVNRGEWLAFEERGYEVVAMGSVAYKLARVAAGLADATWTLVPKNEWDVAAGAALIAAAGGEVYNSDEGEVRFNRPATLLEGLIAHRPGCRGAVRAEIDAVTGGR